MGTVIIFPGSEDPKPFRPSTAVRRYLAQTKCTDVISARVPRKLKKALMQEAFISDARFSEHVARILSQHMILAGRLQGKKAEVA